MSTNEPRSDSGRFDEIDIANGDVVIYDVSNHGAWIQSDYAVDREEKA